MRLEPRSPYHTITRPLSSPAIGKTPSRANPEEPPSPPPSKPDTSVDPKTISEREAQWLLSLPDKARKLRFTREEHLLLTIRCKKALELTSPELAKDVYRRCLSSTGDKVVAFRLEDEPSSSAGGNPADDADSIDVDASPVDSTESTGDELQIFELYSPPDTPGFMQINTKPLPSPSPPPSPDPQTVLDPPSRLRKPLHRVPLTPLPLPPPTLAPPVRPTSILRRSSSSAELFHSLPRRESLARPTTANARLYEDAASRKYLWNTNARQQLDEAIEFGFPTASDFKESSSAVSESFPFQHPPLRRLDTGQEDQESIESPGPRTPVNPLDDEHVTTKQASFDSDTGMPPRLKSALKAPSNRRLNASMDNRKKVIHMALSRPDLRSPEMVLYDVQRQLNSGIEVEKEDPLALETLSVCDDPTGAQGAFAVHGIGNSKRLKRVWNSLRGY